MGDRTRDHSTTTTAANLPCSVLNVPCSVLSVPCSVLVMTAKLEEEANAPPAAGEAMAEARGSAARTREPGSVRGPQTSDEPAVSTGGSRGSGNAATTSIGFAAAADAASRAAGRRHCYSAAAA